MKRTTKAKAAPVKKQKQVPFEDLSLSDAEGAVKTCIAETLEQSEPYEPESPAMDPFPLRGQTSARELDDNGQNSKEDIEKLTKRLRLLEHKFKKGHALSEFVVPNEVVAMADKVSEKTQRFQTLAGLTVAEVVACQDVFAELLALNFGQNLATLYRVKPHAKCALNVSF